MVRCSFWAGGLPGWNITFPRNSSFTAVIEFKMLIYKTNTPLEKNLAKRVRQPIIPAVQSRPYKGYQALLLKESICFMVRNLSSVNQCRTSSSSPSGVPDSAPQSVSMRSIASSYACSELTGRIFMLHLRRIYFVIVLKKQINLQLIKTLYRITIRMK